MKDGIHQCLECDTVSISLCWLKQIIEIKCYSSTADHSKKKRPKLKFFSPQMDYWPDSHCYID